MFVHGFPPEWSTFKKLIWLVGAGIIGGASAVWKTVTGTLIHITDALASPMQKCEVALEPIQEGSGDPSPTNVRPITGRTGCEVTRTGKNLVKAFYKCYFYGSSAQPVFDNNSESILFYAVEGEKYVLSSNPSPNRFGLALVGTETVDRYTQILSYYSISSGVSKWTATWTGWTLWFMYGSANASVEATAQIEIGEIETDYEAPNITTLSVTFPDSAGTVYGTLDMVTGELVVNKVKVTLDGITNKVNSNYTRDNWIVGGWVYATPNGKSGIAQVLCDKLKVIDQYASYTTPYCLIPSDAGNLYFRILLTHDAEEQGVVDKATCLAYVNNWLQQNPVSIVYRLKEPITYQLTPQEISTLAGENNIWSNGDSVEITYKAQA